MSDRHLLTSPSSKLFNLSPLFLLLLFVVVLLLHPPPSTSALPQHPLSSSSSSSSSSQRHLHQQQQQQQQNDVPQSQVYRTWAARPPFNCSVCGRELEQVRRQVEEEKEQRQALKGSLETYVSELYELRAMVKALNSSSSSRGDVARAQKYSANTVSSKRTPSISFSAKLSYNREMKPLDTVIFDTIITNNGEGYNAETGKFTAPLPGTYLFFATVLSGYNTKVETALIVNDKEVARIYSGAHDAHGSGSNAAILNLKSGETVWVRLLYQGGNHVHGYYSTFSGAFLTQEEEGQ